MVDIHAHILPWIDDGASDMEETLEMARMAVESGVTNMVATPHCNIPGLFENYYNREYMEVFMQVREALEKEEIPLVLHTGMEVFGTEEVPELFRAGKLQTLNKSQYLLVEFGFEENPYYVNEMLRRIRSCKIRPVIAHAERYEFVQNNPQIAYEWWKEGYLVQMNKGSILGRFGKKTQKTASRLLRHKLVSVIASDCHSSTQRTPWMLDVKKELEVKYPEKYLQVLFEENPARICANMPTYRFKAVPFETEER